MKNDFSTAPIGCSAQDWVDWHAAVEKELLDILQSCPEGFRDRRMIKIEEILGIERGSLK